MTAKMPPVPPANQSSRSPVASKEVRSETGRGVDPGDRNFDRQGQQGDIKENTTHQGYQQDR